MGLGVPPKAVTSDALSQEAFVHQQLLVLLWQSSFE